MRERNEGKVSKQPLPTPYASTVGPWPSIIQIGRMPRHWKLPSTIAQPNSPPRSWITSEWKKRWNVYKNKMTTKWNSTAGNKNDHQVELYSWQHQKLWPDCVVDMHLCESHILLWLGSITDCCDVILVSEKKYEQIVRPHRPKMRQWQKFCQSCPKSNLQSYSQHQQTTLF